MHLNICHSKIYRYIVELQLSMADTRIACSHPDKPPSETVLHTIISQILQGQAEARQQLTELKALCNQASTAELFARHESFAISYLCKYMCLVHMHNTGVDPGGVRGVQLNPLIFSN